MSQDNKNYIRLRYYPVDAAYFYYELYIDAVCINPRDYFSLGDNFELSISDQNSPKFINTIQFVYSGDAISKRQLSSSEVTMLAGKISQLNFSIYPEIEKLNVNVDPEITSCIMIESPWLTVSQYWTNSEEESGKNKALIMKSFAETLTKLLEVDTSNLDMPVYK